MYGNIMPYLYPFTSKNMMHKNNLPPTIKTVSRVWKCFQSMCTLFLFPVTAKTILPCPANARAPELWPAVSLLPGCARIRNLECSKVLLLEETR